MGEQEEEADGRGGNAADRLLFLSPPSGRVSVGIFSLERCVYGEEGAEPQTHHTLCCKLRLCFKEDM